jgi:hypothetical protein
LLVVLLSAWEWWIEDPNGVCLDCCTHRLMLLFFCRVAVSPVFLFVVRKYNNTPLWVACCYLYCLYCIGG